MNNQKEESTATNLQKNQSKRLAIAELRKAVSNAAGRPMILTCHDDRDSLMRAQDQSFIKHFENANLTKDTLELYGLLPTTTRNIDLFSQKLKAILSSSDALDLAPRLIFDSELGICAAGSTAAEAQMNFEKSESLYNYLKSSSNQPYLTSAYSIENEIQLRQVSSSGEKKSLFKGEIALITGAASGIGKACVESLLERGAAVIGLDINPVITALFNDQNYLGFVCDLSNETEIIQVFESVVRAFGGLDMLVINAGIFPASCKIESLQLTDWHKSFSLNLDANLVLLRESYPLFKLAARHGRVAVNSSRNVPAPGPGAASYSASKAALTQLARVAALEWGKDHINVNIVNPHAVFDTGIWTDEVLKTRAANYNLTVDQYKKNNILQVELTSRDIAEMLAEMCGPLFEKTTGAQVPLDGGSDRVI